MEGSKRGSCTEQVIEWTYIRHLPCTARGATTGHLTSSCFFFAGRSTCKRCKQLIENQTLRIGREMDLGDYSTTHWHHLECWRDMKVKTLLG